MSVVLDKLWNKAGDVGSTIEYPNQGFDFSADYQLTDVLRRCLDISVSMVALTLTLPIMILVAIIIKLDSPGPVLFWQTRMTQRKPGHRFLHADASRMAGQPFKFVKFRTMYVDAKERFPELYQYDYSDQEIDVIKFKIDEDPRVTRVGAWLRKSTLDEFPNFWCVLRGDMSLVGPRPEIPEMSPYYRQADLIKFQVPAGVTGPAQVSGRGLLSFKDTVSLDVEYAKTRTLTKDIEILWKTLTAVIFRTGAF